MNNKPETFFELPGDNIPGGLYTPGIKIDDSKPVATKKYRFDLIPARSSQKAEQARVLGQININQSAFKKRAKLLMQNVALGTALLTIFLGPIAFVNSVSDLTEKNFQNRDIEIQRIKADLDYFRSIVPNIYSYNSDGYQEVIDMFASLETSLSAIQISYSEEIPAEIYDDFKKLASVLDVKIAYDENTNEIIGIIKEENNNSLTN